MVEIVRSTVRAVRIIPAVHAALRLQLNLPRHIHSLGLFTADSDDVAYIAADEATKHASVEVFLGNSLYGGAAQSASMTSGEVIVVLGGPSPSEVQAGLDRAIHTIEHGPAFHKANAAGTSTFLSCVIASAGSYLSAQAGINVGESFAYLIAPPLEAIYGLDMALKSANVELARFIHPPSHTNFSGAFLTGDEASCGAACDAFSRAVIEVANRPIQL